MNFPISFFIFMVVLFLYVHVNHQYKKSQDLEIYELDYKGIENLQETCDIRQPVVFDFDPVIKKYAPINLDVIFSVEKENGNTLNLKDTADYFNVNNSKINPTEVPVSFHSTIQLIKTENTSAPHLFTENNHEFIEETGFDTVMIKIGNAYLKPNYTINQTFDIMTASKGVELPMRYHTFTRKYIYVSTGRIVVKMAPFKNVKKLNFDNQLLVSPMNCWKPQPEYVSYINKVRFLEFDIIKGHVLYVPPYWIYSISYADNNTCLLEYNYQTIMNVIAHPTGVINSLQNTAQSLFNSFKFNTDSTNEIVKEEINDDMNETNSESEIYNKKTLNSTNSSLAPQPSLQPVIQSTSPPIPSLHQPEYDLSVIANSSSTPS